MITVGVTEDLRFVVVASPDYLVRHPRPATPQDLHAHNCISSRRRTHDALKAENIAERRSTRIHSG
jgi:DNA-binding transcriptional LysR family regulator